AAMLDAFAGRDIYCEMASVIFGTPVTKADKERRQLGKICVLGLGYQMGANKLAASAKLGGSDLDRIGVSAEQCVRAFRVLFPAVPLAWRALNRAFIDTIERGGERVACRCVFLRRGDSVVIRLPSGRELTYRNARMEMIVPVWGGEPRPSPCYTSSHGYRKSVYGGILMENISQATCRDLLADAMIDLDHRGEEVIMHVHDEIVNECDEDDSEDTLRTMLLTMSRGPDWSEGFPLACEGYTGIAYTKAVLPGFFHGAASAGKITAFGVAEGGDKTANAPTGYNTIAFGPTRFDPESIAPDAPQEWPYWTPNEPGESEEGDLLAGIECLDDVYEVARRYGISPE